MYVHHSLHGCRTARDEGRIVGGCLRGREEKTFHAKEGSVVRRFVQITRIRHDQDLNLGVTLERHARPIAGLEDVALEGGNGCFPDHLVSLNLDDAGRAIHRDGLEAVSREGGTRSGESRLLLRRV